MAKVLDFLSMCSQRFIFQFKCMQVMSQVLYEQLVSNIN